MAITINATARDDMGKGASRRLRREAKLPGIVYGAGKEPVNITMEQKDIQHQLDNESFYTQVLSLNVDGSAEDVLVRDLQHHPYKMDIMHIDFQRVDAKKEVHVLIPLHFENEETSPGVKTEGGAVQHIITEVEVTCLPGDLPEFIVVDVGEMHTDDILHLSDLKLPKGVELAAFKQGVDHEHDSAVVSIHARKAEAADDAEEAASDSDDAAAEGGED